MTGVEFLRDYCKANDIKISKVESDLGYANGYFNPKKLKKIPIKKAVDIAEYLKIDVFELLDEEDTQKLLSMGRTASEYDLSEIGSASPTRIPVLGRVAAGIPISAVEEIIGWEDLPTYAVKGNSYFGLRIKGNSMEPGIQNGDTVIIKQQDVAEDGQIVVAIVNGNDGCCKRFKKYENGTIALMSDNPAYPPMYFNTTEIDNIPVRICGVVVELRRKF